MANGGYYWVSGKLVYQRDDTAEGIINTIQITDGVTLTDAQKFYVRYIVTNLIRAGIWSKIKALYGFVGGTAATHKWNWKDMRDLDAAYRLTWNGGGWVHNEMGAQPLSGGGASYARTYFSMLNFNSKDDIHISYFTNTKSPVSGSSNTGVEMGAASLIGGQPPRIQIQFGNSTTDIGVRGVVNEANQNTFITPSPFTANFIISSRIGNNIFSYYDTNRFTRNNVSPSLENTEVFLNNVSTVANRFSYRRVCFSSLGDGLTDQECILMSNIITFAQGILGRQ